MLELEREMSDPHFWDSKKDSERVIGELNVLKASVECFTSLQEEIHIHLEMCTLLEEHSDAQLEQELIEAIPSIEKRLKQLEIETLFRSKYDTGNAIVEIHSGAGGTEACDWAEMLFRMYVRWCDKKNFSYDIIYEQLGEEAGIKGVSFVVKGMYAFGYLKNERGVHRLIRLSPFDSNSRRHTSFASIEVTPLLEQTDIDIEIKENDIRIDVYRSSGNGGQGVNTTDSAVRITHFPSKIVVTCQNERSQIQNKEKAMEILKNKLYQLEQEKRDQEMKCLKGEQMDINFGSQIRSYVMHPYAMVKDHRTNVELSNVEKVLDGDLDLLMEENLKRC